MPPPLRMTQQYHLISMAAWLSSKHFPPWSSSHTPSGHLPAVSRPPPGTAVPIPTLRLPSWPFPRDLRPCPGCIGLQQGLSVWFSLRSDCHRSAAVLPNNLKCFSSVPSSYPDMGIWPLLQFPTAQVQQVQSCSPPSLFPFSTSWVLWLYMFLSGGQDLLPVLSWCSASKVYSWSATDRDGLHTHLLLSHLVFSQPSSLQFCFQYFW